jgi:hypothetical protein
MARYSAGAEGQLTIQLSENYLFSAAWWIGLSIAMCILILFLVITCVWALRTPLFTWTEDEDDAKASKYQILAVTVRQHRSCIDTLAVIFGFLPFFLPIFFAIWALTGLGIWWQAGEGWHSMWDRSYIAVCAVTLMGLCVVVSEIILKNIFKQQRPPQSAATSYGFPSGHVFNTYAVMFWILLEKFIPGRGPSPIDWWILGMICAVCVPVPWARYHNGDHSLQQVVVSMFLAGVIAILALALFRVWHTMPMPYDGSTSFLQAETSS